ncbi:GNAT family N-acetyltransferase [Clostridium sp. B9]|uniref:GNAT family N-acetyltransferase n=1 Tax=Clostridium sp. B9 TaxID=3423224 RepID=UPI003D2F3151
MSLEIVELNESQVNYIESQLDDYDKKYIRYRITGNINIGVLKDNSIIAGVDASMTAFKILYVSTLFVDENYRRNNIGTMLMAEVEKRARQLGANMIRLDTFNWQGKDFYSSLGYEEVGFYENKEDGFSEHFFLKRL